MSRARTLELLSTRAVDPRRVALLPEAPPQDFGRAEGAVDEVHITHYGPDRIRLSVTTTAPGLLVLSEVYYPAWKAKANGQAARVHAAKYLLRAVPVPAGRSEVELWYESDALTIGLLVSSACYAGLACIAILVILGRRRQRLIRAPS
ncbi:MAG: YfhO family protein [Chloroflexota bacterium]|nr:YfhO family protein [Chloroflexota bacterium]